MAPAMLAMRKAVAIASLATSSCASTTAAASRRGRWPWMKSADSAAFAPGATTMTLRPWPSTKMPAAPDGSCGWISASRLMPSACASAKAWLAARSSPSAVTKVVDAPARAAATAWLKPLPPGPPA